MRTPRELHEHLCLRRQVYVRWYGALSSYTDLDPPLERGESDALAEWMRCGAGPRDLGMLTALEAHWWAIHQVERGKSAVRWRYVSGGRAAHAFVGDAEAPLCGVVPVRQRGRAVRWIDGERRYSYRRGGRHGDCVRAAKDRGLTV